MDKPARSSRSCGDFRYFPTVQGSREGAFSSDRERNDRAAVPSDDRVGQAIHRLPFLAHGQVPLCVQSDLALSVSKAIDMQYDVRDASKHSRAPSIGLAFDLNDLIAC